MVLDIISELPASCSPSNPFLELFSRLFHACIPTPLSLISTLFGVLSISAWLFAQLPQIIKNFQAHSTSGLSIFFLTEWLLGDLSNLLGSIFTEQATWQIVLASYYCAVDCVLVGQWLWYEHLRHGRVVRRLKWWRTDGEPERGRSRRRKKHGKGAVKQKDNNVFLDPSSAASGSKPIATPHRQRLLDISGSPSPRFPIPIPGSLPGIPQMPLSFPGTPLATSPAAASASGGRVLRPSGSRSPMFPGGSPKTTLLITLLIAVIAAASPHSEKPLIAAAKAHTPASASELLGTVLSWMSTVLYLGSRLPQLLHNYTRRSTSGLSPVLFAAAFFGNLFYSSSLLSNPSLWSTFDPYNPHVPNSGGRGWAPKGSSREKWAINAAPFFLGAAGVLAMDAAIGVQFLIYGDGVDAKSKSGERVVLVVETEPGVRGPSRWMRVNGWMRGWMPAASSKTGKLRAEDDGMETDTDIGSETDLDTEASADTETDAEGEEDSLLGSGKKSQGYGSLK